MEVWFNWKKNSWCMRITILSKSNQPTVLHINQLSPLPCIAWHWSLNLPWPFSSYIYTYICIEELRWVVLNLTLYVLYYNMLIRLVFMKPILSFQKKLFKKNSRNNKEYNKRKKKEKKTLLALRIKICVTKTCLGN